MAVGKGVKHAERGAAASVKGSFLLPLAGAGHMGRADSGSAAAKMHWAQRCTGRKDALGAKMHWAQDALGAKMHWALQPAAAPTAPAPMDSPMQTLAPMQPLARSGGAAWVLRPAVADLASVSRAPAPCPRAQAGQLHKDHLSSHTTARARALRGTLSGYQTFFGAGACRRPQAGGEQPGAGGGGREAEREERRDPCQ